MFDATSKNILGIPAGSRPGNCFYTNACIDNCATS